jgi:hypothetical protein
MQFFKVVFAFLSVGGATYAFIKLNETPAWLKAVSILMAVAAIIIALPDLPRGIDALKESGQKLGKLLPPAPSPSTYRYEPSEVRTSPRQTYTAPSEPLRQTTYTPPAPKCAAVVMASNGSWGGSVGSGLKCSDRLQRARTSCNSHAGMGTCGPYAAGGAWVAGIHCNMRMQNGRRWGSFARPGASESEAFDSAFAAAAPNGFARISCVRRVALWAEDPDAPRRY